MPGIKDSDNTSIEEINTITNPNTKSLIDRYVFASNFCKGKTVLDCACGHGYGGVILRGLGANYVKGLDIDTDAVVAASNRYGDFLEFGPGDVTKDWDTDDQYDVVVSIETFEHVPRETVPQMLKNFKRVCKPGGTIIITTPRRQEPEFVYRGGTHLYEYNVNEFIEELMREFSDIQLFAGVEFRAYSQELQTSFSNNPDDLEKCAIMVAVIQNE